VHPVKKCQIISHRNEIIERCVALNTRRILGTELSSAERQEVENYLRPRRACHTIDGTLDELLPHSSFSFFTG